MIIIGSRGAIEHLFYRRWLISLNLVRKFLHNGLIISIERFKIAMPGDPHQIKRVREIARETRCRLMAKIMKGEVCQPRPLGHPTKADRERLFIANIEDLLVRLGPVPYLLEFLN